MTAVGQTRTSADIYGTTASPPKADMPGSPSEVAEGPQAVIHAHVSIAADSTANYSFAARLDPWRSSQRRLSAARFVVIAACEMP
jgi:hypothetical protein